MRLFIFVVLPSQESCATPVFVYLPSQMVCGIDLPQRLLLLDENGEPVLMQEHASEESVAFWGGRVFYKWQGRVGVRKLCGECRISSRRASKLLTRIEMSPLPEFAPQELVRAHQQFSKARWVKVPTLSSIPAVSVYYRGKRMSPYMHETGGVAYNPDEARDIANDLFAEKSIGFQDYADLLEATFEPNFYGMEPDPKDRFRPVNVERIIQMVNANSSVLPEGRGTP